VLLHAGGDRGLPRNAAKAEGRSTLFRSPWRDADPADHPDAPFVIRMKAPREGETVIRDRCRAM
jgi:glutamyl-tRNA synthetase